MSLVSSVNTAMVGHLGAAATAAVGLTAQPRMLMLAIFMATNVGVTAIVARRKGEGRQGDANRTMRNAIVLILLLAGGITAFAILAAYPLMQMVGAKETPSGWRPLISGSSPQVFRSTHSPWRSTLPSADSAIRGLPCWSTSHPTCLTFCSVIC